MTALRPVYCTHASVKPPAGKRRDSQGRVKLCSVLNATGRTVVTAPWCPRDHHPEEV